MQAAGRHTPAWEHYTTLFLRGVFVAVLIGRFLFPFFYNPLDRVYSDMQRHLENGINLLHPDFEGSSDPKVYQAWIYLLRLFPLSQTRSFSALFAGLLCAGMAWFWYKALRETTTRRKSLVLGIVLGAHPSFLVLYSFFLIETMALTLTALSVWMTFRGVRKRTFSAFMGATLCWVAASFTKETIIPIMLMGMGYALSVQSGKLRSLLTASVLFMTAAIPAGWHSMQALHFFAPFGYTGKETILRKSGHTQFGFYIRAGDKTNTYWWMSPSFAYNELQPIGVFTPERLTTRYMNTVDPSEGRAAWNAIIAKAEKEHTWHHVVSEYEENVIYLFFSHSWPDANPRGDYLLPRLNFHLRWLWFPCFAFVLIFGPFARMKPQKDWILLVTIAMTWMFLLQDVGIIEGRYRKIFEPFLILSVVFLIETLVKPADGQHISLRRFITQTYIYSFLMPVVSPTDSAASPRKGADNHGGNQQDSE
jgi:hypothetical protein